MELQITDTNFPALLGEGKPLVVDCWAPWCGPCKMMLPVIEKLANEYEPRVQIGKLNVDENDMVTEQYGIMTLPTMLFFRNGELIDRHVGPIREADLQQKINTLYNL